MNKGNIEKKNNKRDKYIGLLIWYILTLGVVFIDLLISKKLQSDLYLRPWVTYIVGFLLIAGTFIIPIVLTIYYCYKKKYRWIIGIIQTTMVCVGVSIVTIVVILFWRFNEKSLWNLDVIEMNKSGELIEVVQLQWLDDPMTVTYEIENLFLAKRVD